MPTISFDVPTGDVPDVQAALCESKGYTVVNAANAKAALVAWVKGLTKQYRNRQAHIIVAEQPEPGVT